MSRFISQEKSVQRLECGDHGGLWIPPPASEYTISYFNAEDKADGFPMVLVDRDEAWDWNKNTKHCQSIFSGVYK